MNPGPTNADRRAASANRYEFSSTLESLRPAEPNSRKPINPAVKNFLFVSFLFVAIFACAFLFYATPAPKMEARSDAFYSAQQFVSARLKSPATARFCSKSDASVSTAGAKTIVSGYVDSQNSFGAMIRSRWTVTLNADGSLGDVKISAR